MSNNIKAPRGQRNLLELAPTASRLGSNLPLPIPGHTAPRSQDCASVAPPNPILMKQAAREAPPASPPSQTQLDRIAAAKVADTAANQKRRQVASLNDRGIPQIHHELIVTDKWKPNAATDAIADFLDDPKGLVLVIAGPVGRGKSAAAALMITQPSPDEYQQYTSEYIDGLEELTASNSVPWPAELHPRFITSADWSKLDQYKKTEIAPYRNCSMLAIDDLGTEFADSKDYFLRHLIILINYRHSQGLRTLITTNFTMTEFKDFVGEQVEDRIRQCGRFVGINGESYRGRG